MAKKNYLECELDQLIENDPSIRQFIRSASLEGLWYWDLENPEHEWTSEEFWKVLGFDHDAKKHFASEWQALIFEEDLEATQANLEKHLADPDYSFDQVVRYRREDGGTTWVRSRGIAIRDASGTPTRLLGAHTDLSEVMNMRNDLEGANGVLGLMEEMLPKDPYKLDDTLLPKGWVQVIEGKKGEPGKEWGDTTHDTYLKVDPECHKRTIGFIRKNAAAPTGRRLRSGRRERIAWL